MSLGMPCSYRRKGGNHDTEHHDAPFLLNFVDSSFESSLAAFAAVENHADPANAAEWQFFPDEDTSSFGWSCAGALFDIWCNFGDEDNSGLDQLPLTYNASPHLSARLDEAVDQLANVSGTDFDYDFARSVFTTGNLPGFVNSFFSNFHQQMPIMHRPTFSLETAPMALLVAIFAVGLAISSGTKQRSSKARRLLGLIEEYIFTQNPFRRYLGRDDGCAAASGEFEVLQAAFIISTIQSGMHDIATRRRIRVERNPVLVAVVRAAGLLGWSRKRAKSSWEEFVADECRIRLGMFTIMYDSHLCLFYSSSPQASVAEMTGDMLCNEELFEAETAIEFERIMMLEPRRECLSMCELINGLTRGARVGVQDGFPTLHPLQLQAVIWVMAGVVHTARISVLASAQLSAVFCATEKWKVLWEEATARAEAKGILLSKVTRHAGEICWLLQTIVQATLRGDIDCS
ncbi:hypothetical protein BFW01_g1179 [Lasiodiplodia theobromae]|uniref:Xylanolytic transcriptional activator regulatory domain-containing protein n=1 Tax=Lasiodiplodia theobromae TaxID=45133 RepID=A0A8H7IT44_9PEZI|nr:hypothetical protein BFW01_g1179 [Lasiodiplodia theobromae]